MAVPDIGVLTLGDTLNDDDMDEWEPPQLEEAVQRLEARWKMKCCTTPSEALHDMVEARFDMASVLAAPSIDMRLNMLESQSRRHVAEIMTLQTAIAPRWEEHPDMRMRLIRVQRVLKLAYHTHDAARAITEMQSLARPEGALDDSDEDVLRYGVVRPRVDMLHDELTEYAKLVLFVTLRAFRDGLRKCNDRLYRRVLTPDGVRTQAFQEHMSISDYVAHCANPTFHSDMFAYVINRRNMIPEVAKTLQHARDDRLPWLERARNIWAFRNGTYVGTEMLFYPHGTPHAFSDSVATRYIDADFDASIIDMDPESIPTPTVDKILDAQGFDMEVKLWGKILIWGRTQYETCTHDDWELAAFLKGVGASGKSSCLKEAADMYDPADVGVIGSAPDKYVTAGLVDKKLAVCYEASKSIGMSQMDFQSAQTGEEMSIREMYKLAVTKRWRTPMLLSGNLNPGWTDNSGSFARRIAMFHFAKQPKADPRLKRMLPLDLPNLIHQSNALYRAKAAELQDSGVDIWDNLPEVFRLNRETLARETNPLEGFLSSSLVTRGHNLYVEETQFIRKFQEWCNLKRRGGGSGADAIEWADDLFRPIFDKYNIQIRDTRRIDHMSGTLVTGRFVIGATLTGFTCVDPPEDEDEDEGTAAAAAGGDDMGAYIY